MTLYVATFRFFGDAPEKPIRYHILEENCSIDEAREQIEPSNVKGDDRVKILGVFSIELPEETEDTFNALMGFDKLLENNVSLLFGSFLEEGGRIISQLNKQK